MEKITITNDEVAGVQLSPMNVGEASLRPPIPLWLRFLLAPLAIFLPLFCLVVLIGRVVCRNKSPRTRSAWLTYSTTLLVISGIASSFAFGLILFASHPAIPELPGTLSIDTVPSFPALPSATPLSMVDLTEKLKPLVCIVAKAPPWIPFSRSSLDKVSFGTSALLAADEHGMLFITCRHVIDGKEWSEIIPSKQRVALLGEKGSYVWADVVGRNKSEDIALLWTPRKGGNANYRQPILPLKQVSVGSKIMTIGHPQGLFFTIEGGLISRKQDDGIIQISAPVSPGASGGPVYDEKGHLAGIVTSMMDKNINPNSENLNFAVSVDSLSKPDRWLFEKDGEAILRRYLGQSLIIPPSSSPTASPSDKKPTKQPHS